MNSMCLGLVSAIAALSTAADATVLYSNEPCNCQTNALEIDAGYSVADSFSLGVASSISQIDFTSWTSLGDSIATVDWAILTASPADGGAVVVSGTAPVAFTSGFLNSKGFAVYEEYFSPAGTQRVAAGDYWLELGNAVDGRDGKAYWDQNDGASLAYDSASGTVGSEAFQIIGGAPTPEPAIWAMMLLGLAGLGVVLRAHRRTDRELAALAI